MKTLVLTAMEEERIASGKFSAIYETIGMGQVNAAVNTAFHINRHKPDYVILLGTCGSLSLDRTAGQTIVGDKFINGDYDLWEYDPGFQRDIIQKNVDMFKDIFIPGSFYTTSSFKNPVQKAELIGLADVVDMESFAVVNLCDRLGIKNWVVKTVSDNLSGTREEFVDFLKNKYNPNKVLEKVLERL